MWVLTMRTLHCLSSLSIITQFLWGLTLAQTYDGSIFDKPIDKTATSGKHLLTQAPLPDIELNQNENYFPEIEFPSSILDLHKPFYYNQNLYNVEDKNLFQNNLNISNDFKLPENFIDNYKRKQKLHVMNSSLKKVSKALDYEYDDATNTNRNKGITNKGLRLQDNIRIKAYLDKNHLTKTFEESQLPKNKNANKEISNKDASLTEKRKALDSEYHDATTTNKNKGITNKGLKLQENIRINAYLHKNHLTKTFEEEKIPKNINVNKGIPYKSMSLIEKMRFKTLFNKKRVLNEPEQKYKPIDPFIRKSNNSTTGKVEENRVNSENKIEDVQISKPPMEKNYSISWEEKNENLSVDKESLLVIVDDLIAITEQMFNSVVGYVQEIEDTNMITDEEIEEIVHVVENLKEVLDILDYLISNITATHSDVDVNYYSSLLQSNDNAVLVSNSSTSSNKTLGISQISLPQNTLIKDNNKEPTLLPMIEAVDEAIDQIEVILNVTVSNTDAEDITKETNEVISLVENLKELLEIVEDLNRNITSISFSSVPDNDIEEIYNITSLFENYTLGVVEEITDDVIELEELNVQTNCSYADYALKQKNTTNIFDSDEGFEALTVKSNEVHETQVESPNDCLNNHNEAIDYNKDTILETEKVVDKSFPTEEVNDEI